MRNATLQGFIWKHGSKISQPPSPNLLVWIPLLNRLFRITIRIGLIDHAPRFFHTSVLLCPDARCVLCVLQGGCWAGGAVVLRGGPRGQATGGAEWQATRATTRDRAHESTRGRDVAGESASRPIRSLLLLARSSSLTCWSVDKLVPPSYEWNASA